MPKSLISYSKKEIEDMIKAQSDKDKAEIYKELDKLRSMIIDINDIYRVIKRTKIDKS